MSRARRAVSIVSLVLLIAAPASAQYFGRNKVQYKSLSFQVIKTPHFDVYFYEGERSGAQISARLAERWYARLSRIFRYELKGRQPLVLYASQADFTQTNIVQEELGEGTGGFTEPIRRRIVLPLGGSIAATDHVIGHELVHAFQYDMTTGESEVPSIGGVAHLPLWFVEGLAEYLSIGPVDSNTAMWLRDAMQQDGLPTLDTLESSQYFPYRWGQAFWAYITGRWGDGVIPVLLIEASKADVGAAIEKTLGIEPKDLSRDWQAAIRAAYLPIVGAAKSPAATGRLLIGGAEREGALNVGPALSPDGKWIAFLSSRGLFSIDLYVADAASGQVVRRLTQTSINPHFASLQFIYSSGAWDAASRRLAVAVVISGRPTLTIFDVQAGRVEREVRVYAVDEILNPTWAPDGHAIAFTGMHEGLTDLYVCDLKSGDVRRITNDAYADLQPEWSPDGRRIAFATDRFSTDLSALAPGTLRLAIIDAETGSIEPVPIFPGATSINPQWSPDGGSIYFTSNPDGVSNLYRVTLATGDAVRLTHLATSVSGITSTSPAISVASKTGQIAVSVYEQGANRIYALAPETGGDPVPGVDAEAVSAPLPDGAALPPRERKTNEVIAMFASPRVGLPELSEYPVTEYSSKFGLEGIGQPFIGVGVSQFGTAFAGGISLYFSDMLRNHILATSVQFNSLTGEFNAKDTGVEVGYFNQRHRWNWGLAGGQIPYVSGGFASGIGVTPQGDIVGLDQTILDRQTERSLSGVAAYPFSRARRVEVGAGLTQISFERETRTVTYSTVTGLPISTETMTTSSPSLTLGTATAAFVNDTATFGITSPVQGERYRFEVSPTFGEINFTNVLADYRRYFMPVSLYTFAARGVYYGRHGADSEDPRLSPLFLGYPTLVRGYDVNSFDISECVPTATSFCPVFDRLVGSQLLIGNLEFRFPLLRPFGEARAYRGPMPIEMAFFADGGVAWNSSERPSFLGGTRDGVASAGVTFRLNLGGIAVGQFDFARPFQRPRQGWMFQFNLVPGF